MIHRNALKWHRGRIIVNLERLGPRPAASDTNSVCDTSVNCSRILKRADFETTIIWRIAVIVRVTIDSILDAFVVTLGRSWQLC